MALPFSKLPVEHSEFLIPCSLVFMNLFSALICICHSVSLQRPHIQTLLESLAWSFECMSSLQVSIPTNLRGFNALWCFFFPRPLELFMLRLCWCETQVPAFLCLHQNQPSHIWPWLDLAAPASNPGLLCEEPSSRPYGLSSWEHSCNPTNIIMLLRAGSVAGY